MEIESKLIIVRISIHLIWRIHNWIIRVFRFNRILIQEWISHLRTKSYWIHWMKEYIIYQIMLNRSTNHLKREIWIEEWKEFRIEWIWIWIWMIGWIIKREWKKGLNLAIKIVDLEWRIMKAFLMSSMINRIDNKI